MESARAWGTAGEAATQQQLVEPEQLEGAILACAERGAVAETARQDFRRTVLDILHSGGSLLEQRTAPTKDVGSDALRELQRVYERLRRGEDEWGCQHHGNAAAAHANECPRCNFARDDIQPVPSSQWAQWTPAAREPAAQQAHAVRDLAAQRVLRLTAQQLQLRAVAAREMVETAGLGPVFEQLSLDGLRSAGAVCRSWREAAMADHLYHRLVMTTGLCGYEDLHHRDYLLQFKGLVEAAQGTQLPWRALVYEQEAVLARCLGSYEVQIDLFRGSNSPTAASLRAQLPGSDTELCAAMGAAMGTSYSRDAQTIVSAPNFDVTELFPADSSSTGASWWSEADQAAASEMEMRVSLVRSSNRGSRVLIDRCRKTLVSDGRIDSLPQDLVGRYGTCHADIDRIACACRFREHPNNCLDTELCLWVIVTNKQSHGESSLSADISVRLCQASPLSPFGSGAVSALPMLAQIAENHIFRSLPSLSEANYFLEVDVFVDDVLLCSVRDTWSALLNADPAMIVNIGAATLLNGSSEAAVGAVMDLRSQAGSRNVERTLSVSARLVRKRDGNQFVLCNHAQLRLRDVNGFPYSHILSLLGESMLEPRFMAGEHLCLMNSFIYISADDVDYSDHRPFGLNLQRIQIRTTACDRLAYVPNENGYDVSMYPQLTSRASMLEMIEGPQLAHRWTA
jgi:hypothetical protein